MNKKYSLSALVALSLMVSPLVASSEENNIGSCGWGTKAFNGNTGIAPQVLAVTTNGTFGNQTFGITSGTSGCTQGGTVRSNWKSALYLDANKRKLAKDMATGQGETLEAYADLVGFEGGDKAKFVALSQKEFTRIFPSSEVSTEAVAAGIRDVLRSDDSLSKYAEKI